MRPNVDDRAVRILRAALPEFEDCYLDLVEIYDEDLTPHVVFSELAEFVGNLLDEDDDEELLERCFTAVEAVATTPGLDSVEVVGYGFLDGLRPDSLEMANAYLGPATERILAGLDSGELEMQGEDLSGDDVADVAELEARGYLTPEAAARALSLRSAVEPAGSSPPR